MCVLRKYQREMTKILRYSMLFTKFESFIKSFFNLISHYVQRHAHFYVVANISWYYALGNSNFLNLVHYYDLTYAIKKFFDVEGCRLIIFHATYSFARVACTSILEIRRFDA